MSRNNHPREDFRFDARYGRLIRKAGIGTIPFAIFYYMAELELSPQEVWLIGYVLSHRWTSELPYPAVRELARRSGVSTKTIEKYKKGLETKDYLEVVRRTRADGGNTSIGWDFSPLFEQIDHLITRDLEQWIRRNPQFLEEDFSDLDGSGDFGDNPVDKSSPVRRGLPGAVIDGYHGASEGGLDGAEEGEVDGPLSTGHTQVEEEPRNKDRHRNESTKAVKRLESQSRATTASISKDDSNGPSAPFQQTDRGDPGTKASPLIDRIVEDYSQRLHDAPKSVRANCTRARRLWSTSDLTEDDFVGFIHEAYRRTQDNSHRIRKSAGDGPYGTKNKMPYFFAVLTDLINHEDDELPGNPAT